MIRQRIEGNFDLLTLAEIAHRHGVACQLVFANQNHMSRARFDHALHTLLERRACFKLGSETGLTQRLNCRDRGRQGGLARGQNGDRPRLLRSTVYQQSQTLDTTGPANGGGCRAAHLATSPS